MGAGVPFRRGLPAPLRSKFFLAPRVAVDRTIAPGLIDLLEFEKREIEVVDLAGHALGQVGIAVDGVLFCSDAVIAPEFIKKHGIPLNAHLGKTLETFDYLLGREDRWFLPAHGTLVDDIKPLVAANRARVDRAMSIIRDGLISPMTAEEIVASAGRAFGLEITNLGQYYLTHLTVMAYISHLLDQNQIRAVYHNNRQSFLLND